MRYARLGTAATAYADQIDKDYFGLSFEMQGDVQDLTVVIDRPTLERLQAQIAHALSAPLPPVVQA